MFTSSMISSSVGLLDRIAPWLLGSAYMIVVILVLLLGGQSSEATCQVNEMQLEFHLHYFQILYSRS